VDGNNLVIKGGSYGATWHALDYLESLDNLVLAADYKYTGSYDMITIGMVGDSITHGSNSSMYVYGQNIDGDFLDADITGGVSQVGVHTTLAYPAQVGRLMWKDVVTYSFGHAGIMLTRYRANSPEWAELLAVASDLDYVTIMLGTNDAKTLVEDGVWGPDDEKLFFDEYKAIMDTLQGLNPDMKFVMFNSPSCWQKKNVRMVGLPDVLDAQEATYNELSKIHTIGFVNMHTLTAGMKVQFTDDIHPNSEGYVMFANIISDYLKSFMKANG
jgi:lysophospholipase L1-like esterase